MQRSPWRGPTSTTRPRRGRCWRCFRTSSTGSSRRRIRVTCRTCGRSAGRAREPAPWALPFRKIFAYQIGKLLLPFRKLLLDQIHTTSAPRPPTSCGSPTSRSSGCPAGRSATRRPSSTASTAGPSRGRSAGTPRRGWPTPRSRRPAGRWHPVRRRPSTATAAATTAGRGGSRSARRTGWPGACRAMA